ncbi:MAG: glutaredoxin domain-containing protein [Candidatus Omnitrophota bacterium]
MAAVKIYTNPGCPYCQSAKKFLQEHRIPFEDYDISTDAQKAAEMKKRTGAMSVPVLDINGEIIVGYDQEKIRAALGIKP